MNVLVLSINYFPEQTGFAPHTTALCEYLVSRGHSATAIAGFPFAPYWKRWPAYRGKVMAEENINGVRVTRVSHFIPRRPGRMIQRLILEGTFSLMAGLADLIHRRPNWDVIVYVGAQPSIAMLAKALAWLHRVPYVIKITDLAAQAAADVEMIRASWLKRLLNWFEYSAYRSASGAIVLCSGFQEALVEHQYPAELIRVIRDSVDLESIHPISTDNSQFRSKHNLSPDDFIVLFSGSMGLKQGLTNVVEAARLLKDECPSVRWILVGDGELLPMLRTLIDKHDLAEQVRILPLQPRAEMSSMFSSADVLLLNQLTNMKDTVIPSKLLTYMAAGRPVLAAVNASSQGATLLRESEGGIIVTPEDPSALAATVGQLRANQVVLQEMGKRNREYAEKHFDQRQIVSAQERFLAEVVNHANRGHASVGADESMD